MTTTVTTTMRTALRSRASAPGPMTGASGRAVPGTSIEDSRTVVVFPHPAASSASTRIARIAGAAGSPPRRAGRGDECDADATPSL